MKLFDNVVFDLFVILGYKICVSLFGGYVFIVSCRQCNLACISCNFYYFFKHSLCLSADIIIYIKLYHYTHVQVKGDR